MKIIEASCRDDLTLKTEEFRQRMIQLLDEVEKDEELRHELVTNTCGLLAERVTGSPVSRYQVSEANRLMFAILANDDLVTWLDEFDASRLNKEEFAAAFAKKVQELDDGTITGALITNATVGNGLPGFRNLAYQCVCNETTGKQSCTCTPVAKNSASIGEKQLNPNTVRSIAQGLIEQAKRLQGAGQLADLGRLI